MDDNTLILDGDETIDQISLEEDMHDVKRDDSGDIVDILDEAEALEGSYDVDDDDDDDNFKLYGFDDLGIPQAHSNDEADGCGPQYDAGHIRGAKRKRTRVSLANGNAHIPQGFNTRTQADNTEPFILNEEPGLSDKPSSRVPGTFGRRNRQKGECLPAYHKRVSHELDSDDELMMKMRDKGFSDSQIADKLAQDGRIRYDQKSISTRIMRIRLAQAENVDFLLKEGYKEWEFEDDCLLVQAHALADIEVSYEIERIRAWRFRKVSEYMRRLNKDALFSADACRERYNALVEGTARIPIEMDDDPEARRVEMEVFRESRERARNKEQAVKEASEALERKTGEEMRFRSAQKAEETASKRAAKEKEKAQRAMNRAAKAQIRAQRAADDQVAKAQRNAQFKLKKAEADAQKLKDKHLMKNSNSNSGLGTNARRRFDNNTSTAPALANPNNITKGTPDPRNFLSLQDLSKLCADRGFEVFGRDADQLIQALRDADEQWTHNEPQDDVSRQGSEHEWEQG